MFALAFLRADRTEIQAVDNAECDLTTVFERLVLELQALLCPSITLDMIDDFIAYYRVTWMLRPQQWNVFSLDMHRTNNHMEGWHNRMNSQVKNKPNIWTFIDLIMREQTAKEAEINQMNHGERIAQQAKSERGSTCRI